MIELAAAAGVEHWRYSLAELKTRADALQMLQWDHTAWLCLHMPRFSKRSPSFADFHPLRRGEKEFVNLGSLLTHIKELGKHLPKKLTEEEIEERWQAYVRSKADAGRG